MWRTRLAGEQGKIRTGSKTGFQLRSVPVRLERGQGQTHFGTLARLNNQDSNNTVWSGVSTHSNRKTSPPRSAPNEVHTVALEEQLEGTRVIRKGDPHTQIIPSSLKMVA